MNREHNGGRRWAQAVSTTPPRRRRRSESDDHVVARVAPAHPTPRRYEEPDGNPVMPVRDATVTTKI